jgi:hypothetical protein
MNRLRDFGGLIVAVACIVHCLATPFLLAAAGYALATPAAETSAAEPVEGDECCPLCRGEEAEKATPDGTQPDRCCPTPVVCRVLAVVAFGVGLAAFVPGFRRHGRWPVLVAGVVGLTLLVASGFFVRHLPSSAWERPVMVAGSGLLILGHLLNLRWGRCCAGCPARVPPEPDEGSDVR